MDKLEVKKVTLGYGSMLAAAVFRALHLDGKASDPIRWGLTYADRMVGAAARGEPFTEKISAGQLIAAARMALAPAGA